MKVINTFSLLITFILLSCFCIYAQGQSNIKVANYDIKPFEVTLLNSDYSMAFSYLTILTNDEVRVVFKGDLLGEKDSIVFLKSLQPSETLQQIGNINLDSLNDNYSNDCILDGSQVTVTFKRDGKIKSIHLSNFYQDDIGQLIHLTNSLVDDSYKVWYDKEILVKEYKRCKGN